MNTSSLNRVMDKSPADSLASLATSAFIRSDTDEIQRVFGAVAGKGRAERYEFFIKHHALTESILIWAVEFWKANYQAMAMTALVVSSDSSPRDVAAADFLHRANKAKLASLIEAMRQICSANGIAFKDVATFAEINVDEIDAKPVSAMVAEFVEMFSMPSGRGEK